jgi:hypothetical protein
MAVTVKKGIFWDVTPCALVRTYMNLTRATRHNIPEDAILDFIVFIFFYDILICMNFKTS